ncbi:hypothetical protein ACVIHH_008363 [Bradyrhizobium sp. USDA 4518]
MTMSASVGERDALSRLHGLDRECRRKTALAGAGRPKQTDHLCAVDELQFGKPQDATAIERGLECEVEAGEGFDAGQARHSQRGADTAIDAQRQLLDKQLIERLNPGDLTLFDSPQRGVQYFQRTWHLECDQAFLDAVDRCRLRVDGHGRPPDWASRLPTAW